MVTAHFGKQQNACLRSLSICIMNNRHSWQWSTSHLAVMPLQVVNTQGFPKSVDFDVNNLKVTQTKGIEIKYSEGQHSTAIDLKQILANIQAKQLYVLRPASQINARIEKMKSRGWTIMLPA